MNDTISNWRRAKLNAIAARIYPPLSQPWLASDVPRFPRPHRIWTPRFGAPMTDTHDIVHKRTISRAQYHIVPLCKLIAEAAEAARGWGTWTGMQPAMRSLMRRNRCGCEAHGWWHQRGMGRCREGRV